MEEVADLPRCVAQSRCDPERGLEHLDVVTADKAEVHPPQHEPSSRGRDHDGDKHPIAG